MDPTIAKLKNRFYTRKQLQEFCIQRGIRANTKNDQMIEDLQKFLSINSSQINQQQKRIHDELQKSIIAEKSQFEYSSSPIQQLPSQHPLFQYNDSAPNSTTLNNHTVNIQLDENNASESIEIFNKLSLAIPGEVDSASSASRRRSSDQLQETRNIFVHNNSADKLDKYRPEIKEQIIYVSQHNHSQVTNQQDLIKNDDRLQQLNYLINIVNEHRNSAKKILRRQCGEQIRVFQRRAQAQLTELPKPIRESLV